jgi:hypothetical protein
MHYVKETAARHARTAKFSEYIARHIEPRFAGAQHRALHG